MSSKIIRHAILAAGAAQSALAIGLALPAAAQAQEAAPSYNFDQPAMPLADALRSIGAKTGTSVAFSPDAVRGRKAPAIAGNYTVDQAIERATAGTRLAIRMASGGYVVEAPGESLAAGGGRNRGSSYGDDAIGGGQEGISEILVVGSRSQNVDIRRTEDDAQPYVVISSEDIERSGAATVEEFLRTRLPMNTQQSGSLQEVGVSSQGRINLRGLGSDETLILIDGRRVPGIGTGSDVGQPNLDGIAPSSIERIEVLPATAGGIYGGSATGGVINVILKRDYSGLDINGTYGNTFRGDSSFFSFNANGGLPLEGGKTRISAKVSYSHQSPLSSADRSFSSRSASLNYSNRPADFTAPPVADTPNICSAVDLFPPFGSFRCTATPLVLDPSFGGQSIGSAITFVPEGYEGPSSAPQAGELVEGAGQYNFDPATPNSKLLAEQKIWSFSLSGRRNLANWLEAFAEFWQDNSVTTEVRSNTTTLSLGADDLNNPFQQPILVSLNLPNSLQRGKGRSENIRANGGLIAKLPAKWRLSVEHSWGRSKSEFSNRGLISDIGPALAYLRTIALTDLSTSPPDLSVLDGQKRDSVSGPYTTTQSITSARASGPLVNLSAGPATFSGYLERRKETVADVVTDGLVWHPEKRREVHSAYGEVRIPIFSSEKDVRLLRELNLLAALRWDRYSTHSAGGFGQEVPSEEGPFPDLPISKSVVDSTDFTIGATYAPLEGVSLRGSYATGMLPPSLLQIQQIISQPTLPFITPFLIPRDPGRGNTASPPVAVTLIQGGNPDLEPEYSKSISLGVIFAPKFARGLRLSIDYVQIKKKNEIRGIDIPTLLSLEEQLPGRVVRGPNLPTDPVGWAGPINTLDISLVNLATTRLEAVDVQLDYEIATRYGKFRPFLVATYQPKLGRKILPGQNSVNEVGFSNGPLEYRANIGLLWSQGPWSASWEAQYYSKYSICLATVDCTASRERQGSESVPSQTYHDLAVGYDFTSGALRGAKIRASIYNVFDKTPPIIATVIGTPYSTYGDPRVRRFKISMSKQF